MRDIVKAHRAVRIMDSDTRRTLRPYRKPASREANERAAAARVAEYKKKGWI